MKTSLIISVYNRVNILRKMLFALVHQSFLPDELIISDDGSQEDILEGVKDLLPLMRFKVKYIRQDDKGFRLAKCKNNAVRQTKGEYLIFNDQDIIFTKNYLKTFIDYRKKNHFCVSFPMFLSKEQDNLITEEMLIKGNYYSILYKEQIKKFKQRYRKDKLYYYLKKMGLKETGPRLRGGIFAVHKADFLKVNGFDENFQSWGFEDYDLGRRLNYIGITGINPFRYEFPIHLYHERNNWDDVSNKKRYKEKKKEIRKGKYYCDCGINNAQDKDLTKVIEVN